ncbi:MAG TPA: efflux RND transporter periplasmic adaptor subunit [Acidobacteriota bacterium]|nr:efflux RND transporter periplasmic adaptor subunit [Acidobacteriota bacterium]
MSLFKKKKFWIVIALIVLVGASVATYLSKRGAKPIEVQTDHVKRQDIISIVSASGKIEPKKKVDISASIPGKIVKLSVEEGDVVKKGDFLLQIDPIPYQAALDNSQAALRRARSNLDSAHSSLKQAEQTWKRKSKMYEDQTGLISQDEYERTRTDYDMQESAVRSAEHQVEQAVADVDRSRNDLDKTRVNAPMSGVVVRRSVEEGEVAVIGTMNNPGTVLLTIADLSIMEAELEVDETDIGNLRLGQKAVITVDAFPGKKFTGEVTEIGNSPIVKTTAAEESTDFKVTITLKLPEVNLRPGLTADGEITTATRSKCLTVPIQSLVVRDLSKPEERDKIRKEDREKEGIFLVENGKAIFRPVKTGIMGEMDIEVAEGLKGGEEIVTGSYQTLRDLKNDDAVKVKKPEEEKAKKEAK